MTVLSSVETAQAEALFDAFAISAGVLPNRLVMAPMTRRFSPDGIPGEDVAAYYRRRAEGGVGLILTEGVCIEPKGAELESRVPRFYGHQALAGWSRVVAAVHVAGARIVPQLWHTGSPPGEAVRLVADFVQAARVAQETGFDGIELHAGGRHTLQTLHPAEAPLAVVVVQAIRTALGPRFPILFRFDRSHLGETDDASRAAARLGAQLGTLTQAGVDIFDVSTEDYAEPAFSGVTESLPGWTRRVGGRPVIAGGGIGWPRTDADEIARLAAHLRAGTFDLVALGRTLLSEPDWPRLVRRGAFERLRPFDEADRQRLVL